MTVDARGQVLPFVTALAEHGDRPALLDETTTVSYAELAGRVADVAAALASGERRLVLVRVGNDVASVVGYLGALAAGHAVLLTDAEGPAAAGLAAAWDPDAVVTGEGVEVHRPGSAHDLHPDLALLLSTSGSTGSPRLVRLGSAGVQANAEAIATYLAVRGSDVAITALPLHYCYGLSVLHSHLLRGAAVVLTSLSVVDRCFWDLARRHGVTSLAGVPHTFDLLEQAGFRASDLPSLRYLTQAGGRMAPERVRGWAERGQREGFDLFVMYGQTEATARMAYLPPDLALDHPSAVGVAVPGGTLRVDVPAGSPAGTVGELVYAGPNVMFGYATAPADLAHGRQVTELRTGDLGRVNSAGLVEVVGRAARFAKLHGLRVDLDRVEQVLAADGRSACCASDDSRLVVAVAGRRTGRVGAAQAVARRVRELTGLPPTSVSVVVVDQLPRLPSGKPDARAVLALGADAPAAGQPTDVAGTFALLLGRSSVSPDDTFVSLGGDSLSYVEASVRLEQLLGHLPEQWHLRPVRELERARPAEGAAPAGGRRRSRSVETGVLLRALAILAVVATHGNLVDLPGGAHLLLALVGFNLARFHLGGAPRGDRVCRLLRGAARVAVPSVLWIGGVTLLTGAYPWTTALLLNGVLGPRSWAEPAWWFWFVEAVVVLLLAVAALLAVPALDRLERRAPFWFPVGLALAGLLTRYDLVELRGGDEIHRAHVVAWLVALGWATARAQGRWHRVVVSALVVATVPGFFGDGARELVVVAGVLALVWLPTVRVPAVAARAVAVLAASSLWIYLSHWQVYPSLEHRWPLAAVAASLAVGVALWWLEGTARALVGRRRRARAARSGTLRPGQRRAASGGRRTAVSPTSSTGRAPATTLTSTGVPTA